MDHTARTFEGSLDEAEVIRKKHRYRQLILSGKLVLPHRRAAQLLGPDCLYRLYSLKQPDDKAAGPKTSSSRTQGKPRH